MAQVQRSIVIDVPPEKVFAVITDQARYPEFLPEVKKIVVGPRTGNSVEINYEVELVKRLEYTLRHTIDPENLTVRWSLVRGSLFKKNEGSWVLERLDGGKTKATYTLDITFGGFIPVPASITAKLADTSLPALLENFKRRAESLAGKGAA